jgi:site-specific DNA-methyltransferase (adenine-specific)
VPYSHEAAAWNGWGTALKPAVEPIVVARKPLEGTVAANVLKYGTGAINIDACRVPTEDNLNGGAYSKQGSRSNIPGDNRDVKGAGMFAPGKTVGLDFKQPLGRFPANLIHDGSPEVLACFPESKGQCGAVKGNEPSELTRGIYGKFSGDRTPCAPRGDTGSAARFFNSFRDGEASAERRYTDAGSTNFAMKPGMRRPAEDTPARFFYCAKASRSERGSFNDHCTVKPVALMRWLITLVTPPGGTVLDPFMGSGTTGVAARQIDRPFIGIEREPHYYEIAQRRVLGEVPQVDSPEKKSVPKQVSPDTSPQCDGYPTDPKPIQGELF